MVCDAGGGIRCRCVVGHVWHWRRGDYRSSAGGAAQLRPETGGRNITGCTSAAGKRRGGSIILPIGQTQSFGSRIGGSRIVIWRIHRRENRPEFTIANGETAI